MTRIEELTLNLADDFLTEAEERELSILLADSEDARQTHFRILQIEAGLRTQREPTELSQIVIERLRSERSESVARGVMAQIKTQPFQERSRQGDALTPDTRLLPFPFHQLEERTRHFLRGWLAVAACVILAAGAGIYFFSGTVGKPVVVDVQGTGVVIERSGQRLPAVIGAQLQAGDMLLTLGNSTAAIGFAPETTRITLRPETDCRLDSISDGKRFDLYHGELDVSAARQRLFHAMAIKTLQAEARVVGTRFTLTAGSNATRLDVTEGKVRFIRRSDEESVKVGPGHYAVVAPKCELAALPFTGGLLREWWTDVKAQDLFGLTQDPRFPGRPTGRDAAPNFECTIAATNQFVVRLCGYIHPPITGDYNFWLEQPPADFDKIGSAMLLMSPTENPEESVPIARTSGGGGMMISPYVGTGFTKAPPPIPLVAGRRYYIEALMLIKRGQAQLSVAWQPPRQDREVLGSNFLSPWKSQ
jgi:FecR protein